MNVEELVIVDINSCKRGLLGGKGVMILFTRKLLLGCSQSPADLKHCI